MPKSAQTSHLNRIQDFQVSAVRRLSEAVARLVPPLPRPPLTSRLPGPIGLVNGNFDRAHRVLENQRRFALALVEAVEPITRKVGERKPAKKKSPRGGRHPAKSRGPVKVDPKSGPKRREAS